MRVGSPDNSSDNRIGLLSGVSAATVGATDVGVGVIVSSALEVGSSVDFGLALVVSSSGVAVGVLGVASGCLLGGVSDPTVEGCDGASWLEGSAAPDPSLGALEVAAGPPPDPIGDNVPVGASLLHAESSSATANEVASRTALTQGASVKEGKTISNRGYSTNLEYAMWGRALYHTVMSRAGIRGGACAPVGKRKHGKVLAKGVGGSARP